MMWRTKFGFPLRRIASCAAIVGLVAPIFWSGTAPAGDRAPKAAGKKAPLTATVTDTAKPRAPTSADRKDEPRVAERIQLDPSIRETPALPPKKQGVDEPTPPIKGHQDESTPLPPAEPRPAPLPRAPAWAEPTSLREQLADLAEQDPACAEWVEKVKTQLGNLQKLPSLDDPTAGVIFDGLEQLTEEAKQISLKSTTDDSRSHILRAGFAVVRRLSLWRQVWKIAQRDAAAPDANKNPSAFTPPRAAWEASLNQVQESLRTTGIADTWWNFLRLEPARQKLGVAETPLAEQRQAARDVLAYLNSTQLSDEQLQFLAQPAIQKFADQLLQFAGEKADLAGLLHAIEEFEQNKHAPEAAQLARHCEQLRWTTDAAQAELASAVNAHYRNSNLRVAIAVELVNKLLPQQQLSSEYVQDEIQGAQVQGESSTSTQLRLALLPDRQCWRFGLEAQGQVATATASTSGPATFYQDGTGYFRARKLMLIDRRSIRVFNAEAEANADSQLNDFETKFDGIPLLGGIVRVIARNQYEQKAPLAKQEVEGKIISRASGQLDQQVAQRIEKAKQDYQLKVLQPLQDLSLDPTALDMETTSDRLVARYRLAGRDQASAHTPRPQAPGDSLLSIQMHETAFNNILSHLGLQGRKIELSQLFKEMTKRFTGKEAEVPEDLPDDVFVSFADHDPVRIDCADGRIRLTIRLKELTRGEGKKPWKNLTVKGYYKPNSDQLEANLVRDGIIELAGDNLRVSDRLALSGIFEKVLNRNRKLHLINDKMRQIKPLQSLEVTQFVVHDGWMGIALGPHTSARQMARAARTATPRK